MSGFLDDDRIGIEYVEVKDDLSETLDDFPEDAELDDLDFVIGIYRENGEPIAVPLSIDVANDLYEFIRVVRRLPGDSGAAGFVSINGEFFVLVRVRGRNVEVVLSDVLAGNDWPIARDVVDYFEIDLDDEEESVPIGDLEVFEDYGISEFELETICCDLEEDSDEMARQVAERLGFAKVFERVIEQSFTL